jgi:hypothetical protein
MVTQAKNPTQRYSFFNVFAAFLYFKKDCNINACFTVLLRIFALFFASPFQFHFAVQLLFCTKTRLF